MRQLLLLLLLSLLSTARALSQAEVLLMQGSAMTRMQALSLVAGIQEIDSVRWSGSDAVVDGGALLGMPVSRIFLNFKSDTLHNLSIHVIAETEDAAEAIYDRVRKHMTLRLGEPITMICSGRLLAGEWWRLPNGFYEVGLYRLTDRHYYIAVCGCVAPKCSPDVQKPKRDSRLR